MPARAVTRQISELASLARDYRVYDPNIREFRELSVFTLDRETPRVVDHRYAERARWNDGAWDIEGGGNRIIFHPCGHQADTATACLQSNQLVERDSHPGLWAWR